MKRLFLRVTGRLPEQEENEEERKDNFGKEERRQVNQVELETAGGARRRWRLAKNMVLVAFKVVLMVLFMTIMVLFALIMTTIVAPIAVIMTIMFVLQVEKDEEQSGSSGRHSRGDRRRLSFLGQQYANMVRGSFLIS